MVSARSIIDGIASGRLPETATYDDRAWYWTPRAEPPADGTLTIRQRRARGRVAEVDSYLVAEQPAEPFVMGRTFLLAKTAKDKGAKPKVSDRAEIYQTIIGPINWCRCTAGRTGCSESCKHRDALAAMIADGVLEPMEGG